MRVCTAIAAPVGTIASMQSAATDHVCVCVCVGWVPAQVRQETVSAVTLTVAEQLAEELTSIFQVSLVETSRTLTMLVLGNLSLAEVRHCPTFILIACVSVCVCVCVSVRLYECKCTWRGRICLCLCVGEHTPRLAPMLTRCTCTQPTSLAHYLYFSLLGAVALQSYAINLYAGDQSNLFTFVRQNVTGNYYFYGSVVPSTAPYRPAYVVDQPAYCAPLNLSCPLSPANANLFSNISFVPTGRPWYQQATSERRPVVSSVYWFSSGGLGVTAAMPYYINQTQLQAPLGPALGWYASLFAPTPAPATWQVQQVAGDDISLEGLSLALQNVLTAANFPTASMLVFVVETNTSFLVAASTVPRELSVLPPGCTSACTGNCCRVTAQDAADATIADAAVRPQTDTYIHTHTHTPAQKRAERMIGQRERLC
jgi:hypothetical protein